MASCAELGEWCIFIDMGTQDNMSLCITKINKEEDDEEKEYEDNKMVAKGNVIDTAGVSKKDYSVQ